MPWTRPALSRPWRMLADVKRAPRARAATAWPASCQAGSTPARGPGGLDAPLRGRPEAGKAAAVVALPDPGVVHDGLVVVADDPAQLSPDCGEDALVGRCHSEQVTVSARVAGRVRRAPAIGVDSTICLSMVSMSRAPRPGSAIRSNCTRSPAARRERRCATQVFPW